MSDTAKTDLVYIQSMLEAIGRVAHYVGHKRRAAFLRDRFLQDAVIRNIEVIGEAAGRVSAELAARHPDIPWRDIAGMRHRLIHGYLKVNLDTVWLVVERDLPALRMQLLPFTSPRTLRNPRASRASAKTLISRKRKGRSAR